ncbi:hypothetical protein HPB52_022187 [Rhipicephalus sanguineus]|uniref:Uncharacterized protein n=1 Tax=Rhipicephalus sanguineus TaxID=34632 RepID=A0A9D4SWU1_RHISA|nr:hypothetical protein HPB52_022187 [Rhipicephalus sanguineus]
MASAPGCARSLTQAACRLSLSQERPQSHSRGRSRSRGPLRSKVRSQSQMRIEEGPTWADRVKQKLDKAPKKVTELSRQTEMANSALRC